MNPAICDMNELHIFYSDTNIVEFSYFHEGKLHNMERDKMESMEKTLTRLSRNFQKKKKKKNNNNDKSNDNGGNGYSVNINNKKICDNGSSDSSVVLLRRDGNVVANLCSLTNSDWNEDMLINLNGLVMTVVINPPRILSINTFPKKHIRVNNFIVPIVSSRECTGVCLSWYAKSSDAVFDGLEAADYKLVSEEDILCPGAELAGFFVKLYCTPYRDQPGNAPGASRAYGRPVVHYISKPLLPESALPRALDYRAHYLRGPAIMESDCSVTQSSKSSDKIGSSSSTGSSSSSSTGSSSSSSSEGMNASHLRLVTFNILASAYAQSPTALASMYDYLQHPEMHLCEDYRMQLVVKELLAYRGHILCLQEVDESVYVKYLNPILGRSGFQSHFTSKTGAIAEGCATFISTDEFDLLHTLDMSLADVIKSQHSSSEHYLHKLFMYRPETYAVLTAKITTIAQISILRSKRNPHHFSVVANTHLFYHPAAAYVRLIQIHEIVRCVEGIKLFLLSMSPTSRPTSTSSSFVLETELLKYIDSLELGRRPSWCSGSSCSNGRRDSCWENTKPDVGMISLEDELDRITLTCNVLSDSSNSIPSSDDNSNNSSNSKTDRQWRDKGGKHSDDFAVSCFVFGDLNSTVETGVIEYLERGCILPSHPDWNSVEVFKWSSGHNSAPLVPHADLSSSSSTTVSSSSSKEDCVPRLSHSLSLKSAAGYPKFTNYTKDFKELLDYIFIESGEGGGVCRVVGVAPFPTESVLSENCAIPSEVFPSDHLAVVVDVQYCS